MAEAALQCRLELVAFLTQRTGLGPRQFRVGLQTGGIAEVIGEGNTGEGLALIVSWSGVVAVIVACVVQAIREGRTGQSIGKTALGIGVVRTYDGLAPGAPLAFARRLCQFRNYPAFCLGWLWA